MKFFDIQATTSQEKNNNRLLEEVRIAKPLASASSIYLLCFSSQNVLERLMI